MIKIIIQKFLKKRSYNILYLYYINLVSFNCKIIYKKIILNEVQNNSLLLKNKLIKKIE